MKSLKIVGAAAALASGAAMASTNYDVVKRYKIIDDKLKTEKMLSPFGEDFLLGINATMNKNLTDVVDDVKKVGDFQGTDQEKIDEANRVLLKYEKTEQTVKVNLNLGFPLPSFTAFNTKIMPNFRVHADVGANIGIRSQKITNADLLDFFKESIPAELTNYLLGLDITTIAGQPAESDRDLKLICIADGGLSQSVKDYCGTLDTGKYVIPQTAGTMDNPTLSMYAKADVKAGFFNRWEKGAHFFGDFNLYALGRMDFYQFMTGTQIANGDSVDLPDELNTEITVQSDIKFGYKNANYSLYAAVEEIKLSQVKEKEAQAKEQRYGYDALMRLHAEALFRTENLSIKPFAGVHKRSEYDLTDGWYTGVDLGGHLWGDRLGIMMRGMVDNSYFTLSPRLKIWLIQLEYSLKTPVKKEIEDVKLSTLHSVDFRIFF